MHKVKEFYRMMSRLQILLTERKLKRIQLLSGLRTAMETKVFILFFTHNIDEFLKVYMVKGLLGIACKVNGNLFTGLSTDKDTDLTVILTVTDVDDETPVFENQGNIHDNNNFTVQN